MEFNFSILLIGAGTLWAMRVVVLYLTGQLIIRFRTRGMSRPSGPYSSAGELSNALLTPLLIAFAATLITMDYTLRRELSPTDPMANWLVGWVDMESDLLPTLFAMSWSFVWWGLLLWVSYITSLQAAHSYAMILLRRGFDMSHHRPPHIAMPLMLNVLIDTIWLPLLWGVDDAQSLGITPPLAATAVKVIAAANISIAIWFLWRIWRWTSQIIAAQEATDQEVEDTAGSSSDAAQVGSSDLVGYSAHQVA